MKITVLDGSPKGKTSVTMQYVHYIQKKFPEHKMKFFNISEKLKKIEKDEQAFQEVPGAVAAAEKTIAKSNLSDRFKAISHDFHKDAPPACNAYFLVNVLHDWDAVTFKASKNLL